MAWVFKAYVDQSITNPRMSFYMVLPSNSCPRTRPDNNASKYLVDYENAINLKDEHWEVAMTEFVFNFCPQTIRKGSKIEYKIREVKKMEDKLQLSILNGNLHLDTYTRIQKYNLNFSIDQKKKLLIKTDCQVEMEFNSIV